MAGVSATGVAGTGVGVVGTDAGAGALLGFVSEKERGLRKKRAGGVLRCIRTFRYIQAAVATRYISM